MFQHWRITIVVAAIAATSFFTALGSSRLWDEDEPKNAVCGQEMFARGDWVVPTFNDHLRTDKPILIYWCMIAAYHVLGVSELAARLPSALAGVGTVVLTFQLGRLLFDSRTGLLASCLFTSALMYTVLARGCTPDSLLIVCITGSLTAFVVGVAARRGGHFSGVLNPQLGRPTPIQEHGLPAPAWICMYVAMGLAVLAKGPIGVVMPLGIVGSYLLFCDGVDPAAAGSSWLQQFAAFFAPRRILRVAHTLRLYYGIPLVTLVALPWYILVSIRTNGEWVAGFLGTHNVGRFMQPMEHHHGLPIYYPVAIMVGSFPGSIFLPVALWTTIVAARRNRFQNSAAAILLCWVGCYVGFFTLAATKLPNYVVPCYPAIAIISGSWLSWAIGRANAHDWRLWAGYGSLVVAGLAVAIGLTITARMLLNVEFFAALPGIVAIAGGTACLVLLQRGRVPASITAFVVTCLFFTSSAIIYTANRVSKTQDGPLLAERVHTLVDTPSQDATRVATFGYFTPSMVYYLGHPVTRLNNADQIAPFFEQGGDVLVMNRKIYERYRESVPRDVTILAEERRFLKRNESVVLIGRSTEVARGDVRERSR